MSLFVRSDKNGGEGTTKKKSSLVDKIGKFSNKTNVTSRTFSQENKLLNHTTKTTNTTTTNNKKINNHNQIESSTTNINNKSLVYNNHNNANGKANNVEVTLVQTSPSIIPNKNTSSSTISRPTTTKTNALNTTKTNDLDNSIGLNDIKANKHISNVPNGKNNSAANSVNAKKTILINVEEKNTLVNVAGNKQLLSKKSLETFPKAKQDFSKELLDSKEKDIETMNKKENNNKDENSIGMIANGCGLFENTNLFKTTINSNETIEKTNTTNNITTTTKVIKTNTTNNITTTTKVIKTDTTTIEQNSQNQIPSTARTTHSTLSNSISQSHPTCHNTSKSTSNSSSNTIYNSKLDSNPVLNQNSTSTLSTLQQPPNLNHNHIHYSTQSPSPDNVGCVSSRELLARFSPIGGHEIIEEAFPTDHKNNSISKNNCHLDINHESRNFTNQHATSDHQHPKNKDVKVIMCDSKKFHAVSVFKAAVVDEATEPQTTTSPQHAAAGLNFTTKTTDSVASSSLVGSSVAGSSVAGNSVANSSIAGSSVAGSSLVGRSEDDDVLKFAVFEAQDLMDELQTLKDIFSIFGVQDGGAVLSDDANEDVVINEDTITTIDAQIKHSKQSF